MYTNLNELLLSFRYKKELFNHLLAIINHYKIIYDLQFYYYQINPKIIKKHIMHFINHKNKHHCLQLFHNYH